MKTLHLLALGLLSLLCITTAQAAAPVNDSILKAIPFTGNYQTVTTPDVSTATAATTDPLSNGLNMGKTIWYTFRAPLGDYWAAPYQITIRSNGGAGYALVTTPSDVDNPATSLHTVTPTAIAVGATVTITNTLSDQPYYLMIAGTGTFTITYRMAAPSLLNDFPVAAAAISGDFGTVTSSNNHASVTPDEPAPPANVGSVTNTVWYKWTPAFSGAAAVDTNFSYLSGNDEAENWNEPLHDTRIMVYQGTADALTPVAGNYGGGADYAARFSWIAVSGTTYYVAVATASGKPSGRFNLNYYRANTAGVFDIAWYGSVDEGTGTANVRVFRKYAGALTASVKVNSANGTATAGSDFTTVSNLTLNFDSPTASPTTAWDTSFPVTILDDQTGESEESFQLILAAVSALTTIGHDTCWVHIFDNDSGHVEYNPVSMLHQVIRVRESDGYAVNPLVKTALFTDQIVIDQWATGGTAELDGDIYPFGTTYIGANQTTASLITSIRDDNVFEGEETVTMSVNLVDNNFKNLTYTIIIEDDDPFIPTAGRLVAPLKYGARQAQLYCTISATGVVSGKLYIVGQSLPFVTTLNQRGKATVNLAAKGRQGTLVLSLEATDAEGGFKVSLADGLSRSADSVNAVLSNFAPVINPCAEAGRYTFVLNSFGSIAEAGAGSIVVDVSGNASVSGRLFDSTPFTMTGYVDGDGRLSVMTGLYGNTGTFAANVPQMPLISGQVLSFYSTIIRPARSGDPTKLGPVSGGTYASLCRYTPPASGQRALDCWSTGTGKATLSGGPLMNTVNKALTISTTNVITAPVDAEKLKLTLVPSTGLFSGSFVLPGSSPAKTLNIYGALIDLPTTFGYGQGFFFDGLKVGKIVIDKP